MILSKILPKESCVVLPKEMKIVLENTGRRFNKEWIFRNIDYEFTTDNGYAILGANGSGKSTFLQCVSGLLLTSEGKITYHFNQEIIAEENIYQYIAVATPALELFEDLTLEETVKFHFRLKKLNPSIAQHNIFELMQLDGQQKKQIRNFSSGMKQRVKIGLALFSDTPVLFLDEPTSNLDVNGISWYKNLINDFSKNRIVLVASNKIEEEYFFCQNEIRVEDFK